LTVLVVETARLERRGVNDRCLWACKKLACQNL
jgi:hypothetical protein